MSCIYVLALERGNYYVGSSNNAERHIKQHFNGEGSAWTKLYKPVEVVERRVRMNRFEEDQVVKEYMEKYGITKVRGGSYTQFQFDCSTIEHLEREIRSADREREEKFDCLTIKRDTNGEREEFEREIGGNHREQKSDHSIIEREIRDADRERVKQ